MQNVKSESVRAPVNYLTIAALRGIAALSVVAFHCWFAVQERLGGGGPRILEHGTAGVDIFFVISGFVMVISSPQLATRPDGWRIFVSRRIRRIVPLYWIMTTVMLATVVLAPGLNHHAAPTVEHALASYLFIPSHDSSGDLRPILADGWTLSFEMMFYVLFAIALAFRINIFKLTIPIFAVLAGVALLRTEDWPGWTFLASELPLEFLFGAAVGTLSLRGRFLPKPVAVAGIALAAAAFILLPAGPVIGAMQGTGAVSLRVLTYGLPAMLLVASLVALESEARVFLPNWVLALGDGSYSIYLGHSFILAALVVVAVKLGGGHAMVFIVAGIIASAVGGLVLYYVLEAPMQGAIKKLFPAKKAPAPARAFGVGGQPRSSGTT